MKTVRAWMLLLCVLTAIPASGALAANPSCLVGAEAFGDARPLPRTLERLEAGEPVRIVVAGGASSKGLAAGGETYAWPARLRAELERRYPYVSVEVRNLATPGETADRMLERLAKNGLGGPPSLVIWETGTADAVAGIDLDGFRQTLQDGIDRVVVTGAEILFMNPQFSRRTQMIINLGRYGEAMQVVAGANGIGVFPRHEIMRGWAEDEVFVFDAVAPKKRESLARRLYDCIGKAVADYIVRVPPPQSEAPRPNP